MRLRAFERFVFSQKRRDVSWRELAEEIGTDVGSVNYVVRALIEGVVEVANSWQLTMDAVFLKFLRPRGRSEGCADRQVPSKAVKGI
jgi:hypothetical protein